MRLQAETETVERYINIEALAGLRDKLAALSDDQSFLDKLKAVRLDASFLSNPDQQLWEPLLTVATAVSEDWYQRGLKAAEYFTSGRTDKDLTHTILPGAYRVFRSGEHPDKIHSITLLEELHKLGIPECIKQDHLKDDLSAYDPEISTRQTKIGSINRNGMTGTSFRRRSKLIFRTESGAEVERELGIGPSRNASSR